MVLLITRLLLTPLTLLVIAAYVPGIKVTGLYPALVAAVVLGILNILVKPILIILTLPITIITLGIFIIIINGALFWFAASFIDGFDVTSFWSAVLGALIVSVVSALGNRYIKK